METKTTEPTVERKLSNEVQSRSFQNNSQSTSRFQILNPKFGLKNDEKASDKIYSLSRAKNMKDYPKHLQKRSVDLHSKKRAEIRASQLHEFKK